LQCLYINARSIINKIDVFRVTVCSIKPDVIGITESWATNDIGDAELSIEGYVMFRTDRNTGNKGGGVILYVRGELEPVEFCPKTKFPEHAWCRITSLDRVELLIGVCYRSGNVKIFGQDSHQLVRQLLEEVSQYHVMIMGDFNYPGIDWDMQLACDGATAEEKMFVECLMDNYYTQHVTQSTRGDSVLDLIITSDSDIIDNIMILENLGCSDHNMLSWNCQFGKKKLLTRRKMLNFRKAKVTDIRNALRDTDWDSLLDGDIEESWDKFKNKILSLADANIPELKAGNRHSKPIWLTNKCLRLIYKKRKVFTKYRDKNHPACKHANSEASKAIRKARRDFEKVLAADIKADKKSFFAYVRNKAKSTVSAGPLVDTSGNILQSPEENVEEFNRFFASVFTKENVESLPEMGSSKAGAWALLDIDISEEIVMKKLKMLRQDKAGGPDELIPRLLIMIHEEICYPLTLLFKKSLTEGAVPNDWKRANVRDYF